jgi:hypothetical protein
MKIGDNISKSNKQVQADGVLIQDIQSQMCHVKITAYLVTTSRFKKYMQECLNNS